MTYTLGPDDLVLVRHAPILTPGVLCGQTDVGAIIPSGESLKGLRAVLRHAQARVSSPALRCRQTAAAIWDEGGFAIGEASLLEQSFGRWEGLSYGDIPDIGPLSGDALAQHAAPGGESFADVCDRAAPALRALADARPGPAVAVVHAGIVRACLALAIGSHAPALRFEVDCLSLTRFQRASDGTLIVRDVNTRLSSFGLPEVSMT